jgi:23S rRNA (cytosine1962-C5)-methyltransferase
MPSMSLGPDDNAAKPSSADSLGKGQAQAVSPWVRLRSATYHPFIYDRMIREVDPAARPGDVVNVYDKTGVLFGRGLFNGRSRIVLRMLTHDDTPIDDAFWRRRLGQAVDLRRRLGLDTVSDAYRLVHAEGDELSGLIAERYADCLVLELFSLGIFQRRQQLAAAIADLLGSPTSLDRPQHAAPAWRVIMRADERVEKVEGFRVPDEERGGVGQITIREHGVRYRVDPTAGHKTGFFCDQRDNRRRFAALCRDAEVLDLCCYTGGFGLCAKLFGGAREVTSVDLDEAAVALAKENANLNQVRIDAVHADTFVYVRQMIANARQYDAVVLDPPKLAASRREVDDAMKKYFDLNQLAVQVVRPDGFFLTCSCSGLVGHDRFLDVVHAAARRARRGLQLLDRSGAAPDHPVALNCPETEYLKALWLRVM